MTSQWEEHYETYNGLHILREIKQAAAAVWIFKDVNLTPDQAYRILHLDSENHIVFWILDWSDCISKQSSVQMKEKKNKVSLYTENQVYKQACSSYLWVCILLPATQGSSTYTYVHFPLCDSEEKP